MTDDRELPLPAEPVALKRKTRTLLEQDPAEGQRVVEAGEWIVRPLWKVWRPLLAARGMERKQFKVIAVGYQNELRLWVMGERPWAHCVAGLAGRVTRRL
jgi:hypothetical protein